jgi:hypothetical protein
MIINVNKKKTQGQKLSENKNQHVVKNTESSLQDIKISEVMNDVKTQISLKYPNIKFGLEKNIPAREIEKMVSKQINTQGTTSVKPDGGFLFMQVNEKKYYILVSEQKKQGTNDALYIKYLDFLNAIKKAESEDIINILKSSKRYVAITSLPVKSISQERTIKKHSNKIDYTEFTRINDDLFVKFLPQTQGNVAERLGKNIIAFDILFSNVDIYPFVVFIQGCDFCEEESTIPDRIRTMAKFQPMNQINLFWKTINTKIMSGGSFFMKGHSMYEGLGLSDWTYDEMFHICFEIADKATQYYLSKEQD